MFHTLDIAINGVFINIEKLQKTGQCFMAVDDGTGNTQALFGEGGAAVEASQPEAARNLQRRQPRRRRALPINTVAEVSGPAEGDDHC